MAWRGKQSGFSLVELMVGSAILLIVFGSAFSLLSKSRLAVNAQAVAGPHLYFETFAASRLKLYFSKLLQWTSHMGALDDDGAFPREVDRLDTFCQHTHKFAYASGPLAGGGSFAAKNAAIAEKTLGADIRMALSTLDFDQVVSGTPTGGPLTGRLGENRFPWGAMVPFSDRTSAAAGIENVNMNFKNFCADPGVYAPEQGHGREFCQWVSHCSAQSGVRNPNPFGDAIRILASSPVANDTTQLENEHTFRMCFAFVGNLFSRTGVFVGNAGGASSTGVAAIDNPAVLGLAIATARFVNTKTGETGANKVCQRTVHEMSRALRVRLDLYTVINADRPYRTKLQQYFKSTKEITSEKLGVSIPNCRNPSRNAPVNSQGQRVCIADPLWNYKCPSEQNAVDYDCGAPDRLGD